MEYRRIYLMPDYTSSSLWTDEPCHFMVPAEQLPLTRETAAALAAWSEKLWDFLEHGHDPAWTAEQEPIHQAEGVRLWKLVRQELGEHYEVGLRIHDPDPDRPGCVIRRIVWDPADL